MKICGLNIDDNSPLGEALRDCADSAIARSDTVVDEMTGVDVPAGLECCAAHGQSLAQHGVWLRTQDVEIQDTLDDLNDDYTNNCDCGESPCIKFPGEQCPTF